MPLIDEINSFDTTFEVHDDKSVYFKSIRSLNPNSDPRTYVIQLDTPFEMIAAYDDSTHEMTLEGVKKFQNLVVTASS